MLNNDGNIFVNRQLYRISPLIFGDMKLDLIIGIHERGNANIAYVKDAHLRPISSNVRYTRKSKEYILNETHQTNIKNFYKDTKNQFFNDNINEQLKTNWPMVLKDDTSEEVIKYTKNWDDTYWAGTQRMPYSLYHTTHESLLPLWLEDCKGLIITWIYNNTTVQLDLRSKEDIDNPPSGLPDFHWAFTKYLKDYMIFTGIYGSGDNDMITMDLARGYSYIRGLDLKSGNIITDQDLSVPRNLIYRERPLVESNGLITKMCSLHEIRPLQAFVFNICFNPTDMVSAMQSKYIHSDTIQYHVKYWNNDDDPKDLSQIHDMDIYDLYTNHEYVPRLKKNDILIDEDDKWYSESTKLDHGQGPNSLDYKKEYKSSALSHTNKISQTICHWELANAPGSLWNVYNGFGRWYKDKNGNITWDPNGSSDIDASGESSQSTTWAPKIVCDGYKVAEIMENPEKFIGKYFNDISTYSGGVKFGYKKKDSSDPDKIYVGLATTPEYTSFYDLKTGNRAILDDPEVLAIWVNRYGPDGEDNLPATLGDQKPGIDTEYDIALDHDMDNRYYPYFTDEAKKTNNGHDRGAGGSILNRKFERFDRDTYRYENNSYGLYVAVQRKKFKSGAVTIDGLFVMFWTPRVKSRLIPYVNGDKDKGKDVVDRPGYKYTGNVIAAQNVIYKDQNDIALSLANCVAHLKNYYKYYKKATTDADGNSNLPGDIQDLFDNINDIIDGLSSYTNPSVIFFDKTIYSIQDNTISQEASETQLVKGNTDIAYVYRYYDKIRPAMFTPATRRNISINDVENAGLMFREYGRNFLYLKDMFRIKNDMGAFGGEYKYIPYENEFIRIRNPFKGYNNYIHSKVPPMYNSLDYDCIKPLYTSAGSDLYIYSERNYDYEQSKDRPWDIIRNNEKYVPNNRYGDLIYDEPIYRYNGFDAVGGVVWPRWTSGWPEYKWFNVSKINTVPINIKQFISIADNTKDNLLDAAWKALYIAMGGQYDMVYIQSIYNITYDFQNTSGPIGNKQYNYIIKATLK